MVLMLCVTPPTYAGQIKIRITKSDDLVQLNRKSAGGRKVTYRSLVQLNRALCLTSRRVITDSTSLVQLNRAGD